RYRCEHLQVRVQRRGCRRRLPARPFECGAALLEDGSRMLGAVAFMRATQVLIASLTFWANALVHDGGVVAVPVSAGLAAACCWRLAWRQGLRRYASATS